MSFLFTSKKFKNACNLIPLRPVTPFSHSYQSYPDKHANKKKKKLPDTQNDLYIKTLKHQSVINLFWWRSSQFTNIGDELNPYIVAFLSKKSIHKTPIKKTDLLGIGSILDWVVPRKKNYLTWGTGTLKPTRLPNSLYKISLLRGPLTHNCFLDTHFKVAYGDPGLICDRIWLANPQKTYDWGLIIHHSQYMKPWVGQITKQTPNILFIDITNPNINEFIQQLTSCKAIASSSLHGLVIADSYHIPNIWLYDQPLHKGGKWKFNDYFTGICRTTVNPFNPNAYHNLHNLPINHENFSYFDKIEKIKQQIIDSFPL